MYVFHSDPGHAWLAVKRTELVRLGVLDQISSCSYQRGGTVYLEEDCDAQIFTEAKKARGEVFPTRESFQENTPIRSYDYFTLTKDENTLLKQVIGHYKGRGYTEEHNFPNEYLLLVNPSTMKKVRLYENGQVRES